MKEYRGKKTNGVQHLQEGAKMTSGLTSIISGHLRSNHMDDFIVTCLNQKTQDEAEAANEGKVEEAEVELEAIDTGNLLK